MKSLLVALRGDAKEWVGLLRQELPGHAILSDPPADGAAVAYVAVGRPPPGLIARLAGLELVLSVNAGIEPLLAPGEVPDGVPIARMVDPGLTQGMVEWVAAQVLAWHRNLFDYLGSQAMTDWSPVPERLARERTVTVLGAGVLGGAVADALSSFGFRTRVWSRTPSTRIGVETFAGPEGFAAALAGADVLVNLLPRTPATDDLLNLAAFSRLARGALVVNAGRGATIVDADLIAALDQGLLSAAVLDVFRSEPLPAEHPFWRHPGVRVSPHVAAPTHARTAAAILAETVRRWERGEALAHLVDRTRGY